MRGDSHELKKIKVYDHIFIPGNADFGWEDQCKHDAPDGLRHCGYSKEEHYPDQKEMV